MIQIQQRQMMIQMIQIQQQQMMIKMIQIQQRQMMEILTTLKLSGGTSQRLEKNT